MSVKEISSKDYFKAVFQSSIIWALCVALLESFMIVTSSSVRYIEPLDVLVITVALFLAYSILWSVGLMFLAFLLRLIRRKGDILAENLVLTSWCIALFLYEIFWVLFKVKTERLIYSSYGVFSSLAQIISAALIAYAVFKFVEALKHKGYLRQVGGKLFAFGLSSIFYMTLYVYLKSITEHGTLNPLHSLALVLPFFVVFKLLVYLIKQCCPIFSGSTFSAIARRTKIFIFLLVSIPVMFGVVYYSLADKTNTSSMPNILFISIDTLRADHISAYNEIESKTSPNIDRIAQEGYLFKRAYSTSSWTLPSHASMMTGLFPSSHNADRSFDQKSSRPVNPLSSSAITLAEVLKDNGYHTAGIISNPFISSTFGIDQGFQFYDDKVDLFEDIRYLSLKDYSMLFQMLKFLKIIDRNDYDGERRVREVNEKAFTWLAKNKDKTSPFFLFLHYNEPHFIYEPPEPYNKSDDGRKLGYFTDIDRLSRGQFSLSSSGIDDLLTLYDGEITYLDHYIGLLFKRLEEWNLMDNTMIIITADHGESFNEHEIWQHGNSLYEEQIRVPFIMRYPKVVPAGRVDKENIVQLVDLMPTILNMSGIPMPVGIQGRSLLPVFKGDSETRFDLAFAEIRPDVNWRAKNPRYGNGIKTVLNKEWKYILYDNAREELYNLELDPGEEENLVSRERVKSKEMKEILDSWSNVVGLKRDDKKGKIDSGRLEQLRSLGYLK